MNWQQMLVSPPPTTGWMLGNGTVAAILRDPKSGGLSIAAEALPGGACEVGPVGLQSVDQNRLTAVLSSVQGRLQGARRAAVVVPTGWMRSHLFDFDELPRRPSDLDQVVSWRLKKLLPINPAELRVSSIPQPEFAGRRAVLSMVGVDRAFADLETCFSSVGVQPGLIAPRLFALAGSTRSGSVLIVQQEAGFLSFLLVVDGAPRLLRTKPLAVGDSTAAPAHSELQLAVRFIRDQIGISDDIEVTVSAQSEPMRTDLEQWWSQQEGVRVASAPPPPVFSDPKVAERLGEARILPVLTVLDGEVT
jgi:hypothetical protein